MPGKQNDNFHEFSLKSVLFKGHPDLYFCYLKSEKIGHALAHILQGGDDRTMADSLIRASAALPSSIVRFAAGEFDEGSILADLFELMSLARLCVSYRLLEESNASIIVSEYEGIAKKVAQGKHTSPFLSYDDLALPPFGIERSTDVSASRALAADPRVGYVKDTKGHTESKGQEKDTSASHHNHERADSILSVIRERKRVSIKDISKVVKNCSEKTIQRELNTLIAQGLVRKEGERRWSVYVLNA